MKNILKIKACISLLKEMKTIHFVDEKDITKFLDQIEAAVVKIRNGKQI